MERIRTLLASTTLLCWMASCGAPSGQPSASEQQALDAAQKHRQQLLTKMRAVGDAASSCRVSDGDCLLTVSERREELFKPDAKCESHSDLFDREACHANLLAKKGKVSEVTEFFQYENWCLGKVVECTDQVVAERNQAKDAAELEARRQALMGADDVEQLQFDAAYARERASYLRSTVPKERDTVCVDFPDVKTCQEKAATATTKLEQELQKDNPSYDEKLASELFRAELSARKECFDLEYDCLREVVVKYGANRESRQYLKRNFKLIEERQKLVAKLPQPTTDDCLAAAQAEFGGHVEKTYANYTKKPITLFRVFLHQAFVKLHSAQLECLKQPPG